MRVQPAKGVNHAFGRLTGLRQHHADALRAFHQLHHQRCAAHHIDKIAGVVRRMGDAGDRQIDALTRQQLQRAQLIARAGDGDRFIQRITAEHFKLAQRGGAVKGNGGANARDHRIEMRQLTAFVMHAGRRGVDGHIAGKRIENFHLMAASRGGFAQAFTRIERTVPGQNGDFHPAPL